MLINPAYAKSLTEYYEPGKVLTDTAKLDKLINPFIANVLILSGLFAFFVIIFAGFKYITGAGDKNSMTAATNMLNYGILGLVVVVAAFVITRIIGALLGFTFF